MKNSGRLSSIDSLRGVAILLVMGFHYFYAFSPQVHEGNLTPFGNYFADFWPFKLGHTGVLLFFMVSGFVIAMTLERCATVSEFFVRRLSRLWPPLAAWSLLIFALMSLSSAPFAQIRRPMWQDLLPSLTLTPTSLWSPLFPGVQWMDFAFWTLVVEVRFYVMAAALYWLLPRVRVSLSLTALALCSFVAAAGARKVDPAAGQLLTDAMITDHLPWFAAGAVYYDLFCQKMKKEHAAALLAVSIALVLKQSFRNENEGSTFSIAAVSCVYFAVFWLVATRSTVANWFSARWLSAVGLWSYSIYLLHDPVGLVLISLIPHGLPLIASVGLTLSVAGLVICLGLGSYTFIEIPGQRLFAELFRASPKPEEAQPEALEGPTMDAMQ